LGRPIRRLFPPRRTIPAQFSVAEADGSLGDVGMLDGFPKN
jgi:hypothetical protein